MEVEYYDSKKNDTVKKVGSPQEIAKMAKSLLKPSVFTPWKHAVTDFTVRKPPTKNNNNEQEQDVLMIQEKYGTPTYLFTQGRMLQRVSDVFTSVKELTEPGGVIDKFAAGTLTSQGGRRRSKTRRATKKRKGTRKN